MILTVILEGISKAAAVLSALMKVYTIPCHDRGYINVMLVLQSCSDSLHILPSSSSETNATSGGVCNFSNVEVEDDEDVIEEIFISINEVVDRGIKQEEIPRDITFPDIKSEPDEVSYFCLCVLLDTYYRVGRWEGRSVLGGSVGGRFCIGWVGGREGLYWVGRWEGRSILGGLLGGSVLDGLVGGSLLDRFLGGSLLDGFIGWSVLGGSVGGSVLDGLIRM